MGPWPRTHVRPLIVVACGWDAVRVTYDPVGEASAHVLGLDDHSLGLALAEGAYFALELAEAHAGLRFDINKPL